MLIESSSRRVGTLLDSVFIHHYSTRGIARGFFFALRQDIRGPWIVDFVEVIASIGCLFSGLREGRGILLCGVVQPELLIGSKTMHHTTSNVRRKVNEK